MAGLPDGYTIDAPTTPSGKSGLPDGYTIDAQGQAPDAPLFSNGSGTLGLNVRTANPGKLLGSAVPFDTGDVYYRDAAGNLKPTNNTNHMVSGGKVYEKIDGSRPATGGDIAQQGLDVAKKLPLVGPALSLPGAASDFMSGEPGAMGQMSDVLSGLTGPGNIAKPSTRGFTSPAPEKVLSDAGQTAHDAIADAIRSAKTSGNARSVLRKSFGDIKNDDDVMSSLSPDQKTAVSDLANTQQKKPAVETSDLAILALEGVMPPGFHGVPSGLLATRAALRKFSNNRGDKSALGSAEKLRQSVIDNDPGAAANQVPAPTLPDPGQLKLQADAMETWGNAAAKQRAAEQSQNTLQAQALLKQLSAQNPPPAPIPTPPPQPPPINPNALPTSITTPAKNIMGGLANAQEMQAAANPLAKYEAAVQANAVRDRQNNAALTRDATGQMAARKAAQAAEEANAEPAAPAPVAPPVAPAAPMPTPPPPIPAGISKKNGVVKETPAPQAEAPPEAHTIEEAPVPAKGVLNYTKVRPSDLETASKAADEFASGSGKEIHIVKRYETSVANKQARIRDRVMEAGSDPSFPEEDLAMMEHMNHYKLLRSREDVASHNNAAPQEHHAVLKRYFGPKWAKSVWSK